MIRLVLLAVLAFASAAIAAEPLRIVCVGDSITQGRQGKGEHKPTWSYRYALWTSLIDAGRPCDFVGSMATGFEGTPPYADHAGRQFPNRHEGRWGWTTAQVAKALEESVAGGSWKADIAIVLLGTNDKDTKATLEPTLEAMTSIVGSLRRNNPRMRIVIGRPFQEWEPFPAMGEAYAALAAKLTTDASPIIAPATSAGWVSNPDQPGATTIDWVHPNPDGDARLAAVFAAAIAPWCQPAGR